MGCAGTTPSFRLARFPDPVTGPPGMYPRFLQTTAVSQAALDVEVPSTVLIGFSQEHAAARSLLCCFRRGPCTSYYGSFFFIIPE